MSRKIPVALFCVTMLVFAATVMAVTLRVRAELKARFIQMHADVVDPLAQAQVAAARDELIATGDRAEAAMILSLSLATREIPGVLDVMLFDREGFPMDGDGIDTDFSLEGSALKRALKGHPVAVFHPEATWREIFPEESDDLRPAIPIVEVLIPLRDRSLQETLGVARFVLSGAGTGAELKSMDRQFWTMNAVLLCAGALFLGLIFYLAFQKLERSRRLLQSSRDQLLDANDQLAFAAKTSAVGSISAHLIHGIKNPLASLHAMLNGSVSEDGPLAPEDVKRCQERVQAMQVMIGDLVNLLKDEERRPVYAFSLDEVRQILLEKTSMQARNAGVMMEVTKPPFLELPARVGNLLLLILVNLAENAIEASSEGGQVSIEFRTDDEGRLTVDVRDQGAGIPESVQAQLFSPKRSNKVQGVGIGLSIVSQMARHIDACIQLKETGPQGTCFSVILNGVKK